MLKKGDGGIRPEEAAMERIIYDTIMLFFAAVGFIAAVKGIAARFIFNQKSVVDNLTIILAVRGPCDGVEYVTRTIISDLSDVETSGGGGPHIILLRDNAQDDDVCDFLADDYDNVEVCSRDELPKLLEKD